MVYALDVYDPLDWSYPKGLTADKSGWQPRNKAWKAEREALWHKINFGPYVSFKDPQDLYTKPKHVQMIEEFFLTGKSKFRYGKGNVPIHIQLYFLFYPDLTTEQLDRLVELIPEDILAYSLYSPFPRLDSRYLNCPDYFIPRIRLLQDYFWRYFEKKLSKEFSAEDVQQKKMQTFLVNFPTAANDYLACLFYGKNHRRILRGASSGCIATPFEWINGGQLDYLFTCIHRLPSTSLDTLVEKMKEQWYTLFLHIIHFAPWNALPSKGLEYQQAFVEGFQARVVQQGLPAALLALWEQAQQDDESWTVPFEGKVAGAIEKALAFYSDEPAANSSLKAIVNAYVSQGLAAEPFDVAKVQLVNLSSYLTSDVKINLGYEAGDTVSAYSYDIELTKAYYKIEQRQCAISIFLLLGNPKKQTTGPVPVIIVLKRPYRMDMAKISRHSIYNDMYMQKVFIEKLGLRLLPHKNFTKMYLSQELGRDPYKSHLTPEEEEAKINSAWYRREQQYQPFTDKPYFLFKEIPLADESLPLYDEADIPPFALD